MAKKIAITLYEDDRFFSSEVRKFFTSEAQKEKFDFKESMKNTRFLIRDMRNYAPNVVLMDIEMDNKREGLDALCAIKNNYPETKVIILTSVPNSDNIFDAFCLRADGFLNKAAFSEKILEAIEKAQQGEVFVNAYIARKMQELFPRRDSDIPTEPDLTNRESEVLGLLARGYSYDEIAKDLYIGKAGVSTHVKNIYGKLGVHTIAKAINAAHQKGIIRFLNRPFEHWVENILLCARQAAYSALGNNDSGKFSYTIPIANISLSTELESDICDFINHNFPKKLDTNQHLILNMEIVSVDSANHLALTLSKQLPKQETEIIMQHQFPL